MKRRFTILTAALALLTFLAVPMGMWGQSRESITASYGWEDADDASQWTISSAIVKTSGQGNTGTYAGKINTNTTTVQYNDKVNVTSFSYALKRTSTNSNYSVYIQTSTDGQTWNTVDTHAMSSFGNGTYTTVTKTFDGNTAYFVRFYCNNTTATRYVDDVTIVYNTTASTTFTVNYDCNGGETDCPENVSGIAPGTSITLASAPSRQHYNFVGWTYGATTYNPGDSYTVNSNVTFTAQWEPDGTYGEGSICFSSQSSCTAINSQSVTGEDDLGNTWTITTVGTSSFTSNSGYYQVGSGNSPATSITFTTTLDEEVNVTDFSATFGGFNATRASVALKVDNTQVGSGTLNGGDDVTVSSSSAQIGTTLTVIVTPTAGGVKCYNISYAYETIDNPAVATTTTINVPQNFNTDIYQGTNAGTLTATVKDNENNTISGATVTWSSSNTGVATIDASGAVTLVAVGTTTITASYAGVEDEYRPSEGTYELTVTDSNAPGTQNNPYTVAQARAAIDANTGITGVYATGIIYQVDSYNSNYNSITYWISDDGTSSNPLEVYSGISGIEGFTFSSKDDLRVGDVVVVKGNLKKFNNSVYEFDYNNQLVSLVREYRVTYDANGATSGSVPTDETVYNDENNTVTVLGNTGTLVKDCNNWGGWNTEEDGSGDTYQAGQTFTITSNTTLYAVWTARTHSYSLVKTGETQSIDFLEIYVNEQESWQEGDPIQCGQQVAVSVVLTDEENYYCTITVVDENDNPVEVSSEMFTMPDSEVTITVEVFVRPRFNITCNSSIGNGTISAPATATLDATVTVTVTPATGYTLNALTATYVDGNGDTQSLVFFGNTFVMPAADVTVSAMFSKCVEDVLNNTLIGSMEHNYADWSNKTSNSTAVYAGNSAGNYNSIQLRGGSSSGIITTASGGKAKKVVVSWNSNTANGRVLQIYGKNTAYSSTADLYSNNDRGTLLGYINYNSSTEYTTELIIPGDYEYIGIRSSSNALYLDEIRISWVYSYTEEVTGHGNDNTTGWQFIASPILENVTVSVPAGDDADLYYYDEQDYMWRNYKKSGNDGYFNFANGTGYLYANRADAQVTFAGASVVTGNTKSIELSYHETTSGNESNRLAGWNLVGNPFDCPATLNLGCYTISGMAINTQAHPANNYTVAPCEGVMVKAIGANQNVTFTKATQASQINQLEMTVAQQVMSRGTATSLVHDNAIVNFNAGSQLEKFPFNADAAELYIPQDGKDYAIVSSEAQGEMPVNFKAKENGNYTLSINVEGMEMNYLHLIDNKTGNDVDLLQTPSYSFEAKTTDYESRFKLVFVANNEDSVSAGSETFAFFSNGSFVINNEGNAELQVIDITGRIVKSESINGCANVNVNAAPGVYMLRLVNGDNVKTQKVVVK